MSNNWHYLHGQPEVSGCLKAAPEDFVVREDLGFSPSGEGEHILLHVRKRGQNTQWVARELARLAGVAQRDVTWAGLKDRHAVTEQWFGVHLPGKEMPDFSPLENEDVQILAIARHHKKLKTGALRGNRFELALTGLEGEGDLDARLAAIAARGVPNYYGDQRFGRDYGNLEQAKAMFAGRRIKDRNKRSLYLSAARSYLFNLAASHRLAAGLGEQLLAGDCVMLAGSQSFFTLGEDNPLDEAMAARFASGDIRLSAPLWGRGRLPSQDEAAALEQAALVGQEALCAGLEANGLKQERRALLLRPEELAWQREGDRLRLSFWLPAGSYATSLVRELIKDKENHEDTGE
ncbi:tRNA pseudouridine(13) synthase TruD [Zobellella denitrificans]|uniref:tRNA pseudouridine synthase D n=1 Tax=Zobellella denitrificans TaxID=347534 RepID=A0A231MWK3_9GAMM|nr:tRNA pseudouridine(13) synthase TruD [Zobellella denitrificans]ATG75120.1 pseudouridine synthase [Zobellella denitrificans]OXS14574.1 tRNA pseudouridine(13) synthase TruD [Zobellella denitrificans]